MNLLAVFSVFAPDWLSIWFAVGAIGVWILRLQRIAVALAVIPFGDWVLAPLLQPAINEMPTSWLVGVLALIGLVCVRAVLELVIGNEGAGHVLGTYTVRLLDFLIVGPFRALRSLAGLF